ncbi:MULTISPECIES: DUF1294 domain-containing protein [Parageobacillus]|uniref:DUF1294 domain-containing protein n=1 Tax=Parageobacillus TaxID=1906945 RepID=UPI000AA912EC|nr:MULTISPECIES: DUF1294 domain-containing protein [Parageobacillus]
MVSWRSASEWRIAESAAWFVSFIGVVIGAAVGARAFRRKTKHHLYLFSCSLPLPS